ncbi:hypothetical protein Hanom_Chr05g00394861 [Helianthus anomalus]
MGPPYAVSKEEMVKRFESIPKVISDLNIVVPQTKSRQTTSGDTISSQYLTLQEKRKWSDSATSSSKKPRIVQKKTPEGNTILVQEIDKDVMMFPEHNLKEYYWSAEDKLDRPLSPISRDWKEERLERGLKSIHIALDNPVVRVLKVDVDVTSDGVGGHYEQNRYTLLRKDGTEERITDGNLVDKLHLVDILL